MNALISVSLLWPNSKSSNHPVQILFWVLSGLLCFLFTYSLFPPTSTAVHRSSIQSQWKGLNVIHNENSIYGNITITKRGEQYTFFINGIPSITTPVPDIASIEDFVHFTMLFHEKPESILILSGGAGGMLHEILKYPVTRVDYVELDPLLLKLIQKFPTPLTQSELSDKRVKIHYTDGRFFIKRTQDRFDIIFIGLSAPQELQTNRLFSSEFFSSAKRKMNADGIVVLTLPGSLTYISPELGELNTCILETLKNVYRSVRIIPGDTNLYLASDSEKLDQVSAKDLMKRLDERKIKTGLFTKSYVEYRLNERWLEWFLKSVEGERISINSDFRPLGVFFSLSYWNALFSPYLTGMFKGFEKFSFKITIVLITIFTLILAALFMKNPSISRYSVPYAIFTTGLTGMIFNLAIIFTFQTLYGYLYQQIGLLVTIFMGGIAFGSLYMTHSLGRIKKDLNLFLTIELLIIVFSFVLPFVLTMLSPHLENPIIYIFLYAAFLTMAFLCGVLLGLEFPLATKIYLGIGTKDGTIGKTAGLIYGADLFGGFFGGLFGGVLLLPILGLKESCLMMAMIKATSFILLLLFTKIRR
jgi:spermidine synthase